MEMSVPVGAYMLTCQNCLLKTKIIHTKMRWNFVSHKIKFGNICYYMT